MLAAMRPWLHETLISSDEGPTGGPEREARLVAAASADTATDAAPQRAHPVADIPAPDESLTGLMTLPILRIDHG